MKSVYCFLFIVPLLIGCTKEKRSGPFLDVAEPPPPPPTNWVGSGNFNGSINDLEVYNSELWIGGGFSSINSSIFTNFVTRYNGTFSAVNNPSFSGTHLRDLFYDAQTSRIYVMGNITANFISGICFRNGTTGNWTGITIQMANAVNKLVRWNGTFIIGGTFSTYNSTTYNRIAQNNGSAWIPMGQGVIGGFVAELIDYNGTLIAAGLFNMSGTTPVNNIAAWNGTSWMPLGAGLNGEVKSLVIHNNELIVAGDFTTAGGNPATNIAKWNGSSWSPMGSGLSGSLNDKVNEVKILSGSLYAAGNFTNSGSANVNNIAKWDGANWQQAGITTPPVEVIVLNEWDGYFYAGTAYSTSYDEFYRFQ